jgi:hypothetical protein
VTLSIADIERWDGEAVREVFRAANARANSSAGAPEGLARLPAFQSWAGTAADAARDAIGRVRVELHAHGNKALASPARPILPPTTSSSCRTG